MLDHPPPNTHSGHPWTDEAIAKLKELWGAGKSGSECARILDIGVSRSAVIGKVHRLNMSKRDNSIRAKPPAHRNRAPKAAAIQERAKRRNKGLAAKLTNARKKGLVGEAAKAKAVGIFEPVEFQEEEGGVDVTHLLGLLQLTEHTCKWPHGDPQRPNFGFCGQPSLDGKPYCQAHDRKAHASL